MCDEKGIEWAYEPDSWLSALGKELGWEHEQTELEYAMSALRPGGAYVDVGAHVGGYAIPITQKVEGVAIHLFEPVASTRELLQRNLARNGVLERVRIWPYAVGDVAHRAQITVADGGANRFSERVPAGPGAATVDVVRLDDILLDQVDRFDVLECDIEGGELPAMRELSRSCS